MASAARGFALAARAKFNVRLEVGPREADGLHALRSVVAELAVCDEVEFTPSTPFSVACDDPAIREESNLALVAARALHVDLPAVGIFIKKRLPLQAGLGGGSADAAAALRGIARVLASDGKTVTEDALLAAAVKTGSDVAACLVPGFKIVEGRGEKVRPLSIAPPPWGVLLLKPAVGVDTAVGYRILDEARTTGRIGTAATDRIEVLAQSLAAHDFRASCELAFNDFQAPVEAAFPAIASARRRLVDAGASVTVLCGSGACVAGLFETIDAARAASLRLSLAEGEWSCATGFAP